MCMEKSIGNPYIWKRETIYIYSIEEYNKKKWKILVETHICGKEKHDIYLKNQTIQKIEISKISKKIK